MKWGKKILLVYHLKINVIKINNEFIEHIVNTIKKIKIK